MAAVRLHACGRRHTSQEVLQRVGTCTLLQSLLCSCKHTATRRHALLVLGCGVIDCIHIVSHLVSSFRCARFAPMTAVVAVGDWQAAHTLHGRKRHGSMLERCCVSAVVGRGWESAMHATLLACSLRLSWLVDCVCMIAVLCCCVVRRLVRSWSASARAS